MDGFLIGVAEFFGVFNKIRAWFKGKKTLLTGVGMMLTSGAGILTAFIAWVDGDISVSVFLDQAQVPAGVFAGGLGLVFAALHPKNVAEKLGPGL